MSRGHKAVELKPGGRAPAPIPDQPGRKDFYPEHDRLSKVKNWSQVCGEFLEWLDENGVILCTGAGARGRAFVPVGYLKNELLAAFFGIDRQRLALEKDAMVTSLSDAGNRERVAATPGDMDTPTGDLKLYRVFDEIEVKERESNRWTECECRHCQTRQAVQDYERGKQQCASCGHFNLFPVGDICHAARDGECIHASCPQTRDNEPEKTGRSCPLLKNEPEED